MGCMQFNYSDNEQKDLPILGLSESMNEFFAPVSFDVISTLISSRNSELERIKALAEHMANPDTFSVLHHFIEGNKPDQQYTLPSHINGLFDIKGAVAHLDSEYWQKALSQTDVLDYMPQKRRYEWHSQIKNPLGTFKQGSRNEYEIPPLPAFEEDTVRATLIGLLNSRAMFFAERVDGVFRSLSKTHLTNAPEGFGKRLILNYLIDKNGTTEWGTCGIIDDLRCIVAKFMGRDEPKHGATMAAVSHIRRQNGVWQALDGGAIRIRIYNGVGTAHIEVHEEIAWKLNAALAMLYPAAIPEKNRKRKARNPRSTSTFELMNKLLPFAVIQALASMGQASEPYKVQFQKYYRTIPNTLRFSNGAPADKAVAQQVKTVLEAIGGTQEKLFWRFAYDPTDVVGQIICSGAIPDHVSHQFYPTPENLAKTVVAKAAADSSAGMLWLEPSAGCGGLADHIPANAALHAVEVNALHVEILKAKGFSNVFHGDFLALAQTTAHRYDRVVMNPPFSQGRWQAHLEAAAGLLVAGGRLVAILPASAKGKELVPGYAHEFSEPFANEFAGTSISVVIVTLTKSPDAC